MILSIGRKLQFLTVLILTICIAGCSDDNTPDPKSTVIAMFGAMERDDKAALTYLLDLSELMRSMNDDYAIQTDFPRQFNNPEEILDDLTGEGLTKKIWFGFQRIINRTILTSETTASVDVTFIDKNKSRGYIARFGLHLVNGKWKIYSFSTVRE